MTSIISVKNLTKQFKDLLAVDNVSFSLEKGEILGLLGPNGAGKTTIFQMLLGVLTPSSGSIYYFDKDLSRSREEILEKINFCSTYTNLPWSLKVSDSFAFISRLYKIANRKKRIAELVDTFNLGPLLHKEVASLSAGELTRVNLAKAFINDPQVVLLDEPTASLDPEVAHFIRQYILKKRSENELSVVFTSHNMIEVETLCDRVLFIQKGRLIANDKPGELARTLDKCSLSFICEDSNISLAVIVAKKLNIEIKISEKELSASMEEKRVVEYLTALANEGVAISALNVKPASLEDYFLEQAKISNGEINVR